MLCCTHLCSNSIQSYDYLALLGLIVTCRGYKTVVSKSGATSRKRHEQVIGNVIIVYTERFPSYQRISRFTIKRCKKKEKRTAV